LNKNYQILVIFGTNIPETTVQSATSPIICFCTIWKCRTNKTLHFYPVWYHYLI